MAHASQFSVYFDGSCPLCRREIAYYQRLRSRCTIDWIDVSRPVDCGDALSCEQALRRFHVRDTEGTLLSGAAGFAALWRQLHGWRWLGHVVAVPPLLWMAEGAYRLFLPLRPRLQRWVAGRTTAKDTTP